MKIIETTSERELQVYQRLASLDEETQRRISLKYYHGTRPWLPREEGAKRRKRKSSEHLTSIQAEE